MPNYSKLDQIKASGQLPSPGGVALQVIRLTQKDDVTNQEIARAIKADPVLSGRVIKAANKMGTNQTRPIVSVIDAISVSGFNTLRQLVLGLSLMESNQEGQCQHFNYQDFWAHSLLTAITSQNLVSYSGVGSAEEVFILGLLGQIGSLALATAKPEEYSLVLATHSTGEQSELSKLERDHFGFDHNQLTQAMLADWGMPKIFQEVILHHENPNQSTFSEDSRNWRLANVLHVANYFSTVCLAQEPQRRKMVPKLIFNASRLGIEPDTFAMIADKSILEWQDWCKLCGIRSVEIHPFAELLEALPDVPDMQETAEEMPHSPTAFYKLRILLVDDDRVLTLQLKTLLEKAGHTVISAGNGKEGLTLVKEFSPQLIITDWVMPEMSGIEFCRALRQNPAWRNIYVFIMTSHEGMEKLVKAFDAGANDYMTKPVNSKVLLSRLRAGQRVVQLQEEMELDRKNLHKFADELAAFNHRLRKSDVNMRAILDNAPYMAWLKDTGGRYKKANKAYVNYVRLKDVDQLIGKTDFDIWPVEIAEQKRAVDAEVMLLRQQRLIEESFFEGDQPRWLEIFKTSVIDDDGNVLGTTGFARDITERKQIEAELRVAATAFESQEGMMITDANGIFLRVNHAFTAITGYTSEEVIGKNPRILSSGRHDTNFYKAMWNSINRKGGWEGEVWNRRKNGEVFPEHLIITAVKSQDGTVLNYVATLTDITMSRDAADEIKHLAFYDLLTRLPNRRLLVDRLQQAKSSSDRSGKHGALLLIDLDNFKDLNETLGHDFGDLLLQQVAQRLESCVRQGDTVARLGGDEFVVMLEGLSDDSIDAAKFTEGVGEKIVAILNQAYQLASREYRNTPSIGAALFKGHEQGTDDLFKQADIAMYQAKKAGRNTLRFFDQQMQDTIDARASLEAELGKAIENKQLQLYYQIQVDDSGRPFGAEALIRWLHPERGMVSPAQFIPLAEETGLILPIGHWVIDTACAQLKIWEANALARNLILSVNVSAKQFRQTDFVDQVKNVVQHYTINPNLLKLEITESMLLDNVDTMIVTMNALKAIGIRFSMDDFGTGYSSLQYLKRLPLNQLKIDQSFVRDLAIDKSDEAIVSTIISMAHSLRLNVIAEGVETEEQRQLLLSSGCCHYQGYLFAKPLPIRQFEALLQGAE